MPVCIENLSLEFLVDDGKLLDDRMLDMYTHARWQEGKNGSYYAMYEMPSTVLCIFRLLKKSDEHIEILGVDTHVKGKCIWYVRPFFNVTPKESDPLSVVVACTNSTKDAVCVLHILQAAVAGSLQEDVPVPVQVVAFPNQVFCFSSRADYEEHVEIQKDFSLPLLQDKQVFPYQFIHKRDPDAPKERAESTLDEDKVVCCGKVLSVRECHHEPESEYSFTIATMATQFGHLDVAFSLKQVQYGRCTKGSYLFFHGFLSADIAVEGNEKWMD